MILNFTKTRGIFRQGCLLEFMPKSCKDTTNHAKVALLPLHFTSFGGMDWVPASTLQSGLVLESHRWLASLSTLCRSAAQRHIILQSG
jgi:hypothetical protein